MRTNFSQMKIALDAMGGDHAPAVTVAGAVEAAREYKHEVLLVGQEPAIAAELKKYVEKVRTELLRIKDINKATLIGTQDEKIYLEFSTQQLAAMGLDVTCFCTSSFVFRWNARSTYTCFV